MRARAACVVLVVITAITTDALAAGTPARPGTPTTATPTETRMAVAFDVPSAQTPEFLCVVTAIPCPASGGCEPQFTITSLTASGVLARASEDAAYHFDGAKISPKHDLAIQNLARTPSGLCSGAHDLCRPELRVPEPGVEQYVTCGRNDLPTASKRVAFVHLRFDSGGSGAGVKWIKLSGTAATVSLNAVVHSRFTFVRAIGGDYAESADAAIGTEERVNVTLHPRCEAYTVRLPPRSPSVRIKTEEAASDDEQGVGVQLSIGDTKRRCDPGTSSGNAFVAMVPYRANGEEKAIRVYAANELGTDTSEFEAAWSSATPPRPIQLGYREVSLTWRRHCFMGDPPHGAEELRTEVKDGNRTLATTTCPEATVVGAGTSCEIEAEGTEEDEDGDARPTCRYRCRAPDTMPAFALPSPVRFARHVGKGDARQVVATWSDALEYAGQELTSYEAPADRSVVVRLGDRTQWRKRDGDVRRAIELGLGGRTKRIELDDDPANGPPWFKIASPGIECADPVRMQIDGTREYWPHTLTTQAGILVLDDPKSYRRETRFGATVGLAVGGALRTRDYARGGRATMDVFPSRPEPMAGAQIWLEDYFDWGHVGANEFAAEYHLGRIGYRGVSLSSREGGEPERLNQVWYQRFSVKAKRTWWMTPQMHLGAGVGGGFGTPLWSRNRDVVGRYNWFAAIEPYYRRLSPHQPTLAVEVGLEVRIGESRRYFETDFHGDPVLAPLRSVDVALELRLRLGGK